MRVLNLNAWWPMLPGARETAAERNSALFEILGQLNPEIVTLQECDSQELRWLVNNGFEVSLGLMSSSEALVARLDDYSTVQAKWHLAVGLASRIGLTKPRCHIYGRGGFWPKDIEARNAEHWLKVGGAVDETNLNLVLLAAEIDGIQVSVTHGPWDITPKVGESLDPQGKLCEHQRTGVLDLCRVVKAAEPNLDLVAGDSNTHSGYREAMFPTLEQEFELRMTFDPTHSGTLDSKYFPHARFDWAQKISPDNICYGKRLRLRSAKQLDGFADHRLQFAEYEKVSY